MEKMKKLVFSLATCFAVFYTFFVCTGKTVDAKISYKHQVFSKSAVSKRIDNIRKFYYKKPKQLKTKTQSVQLDQKKGKMTYYFHGKDLMFSFGTVKGTEYRAYYYKNQLIQLLVDRPGKARKTYVQYYTKSQSKMMQEYGTARLYFDVENYARKMLESIYPAVKKDSLDDLVVITKMKGNVIWYHYVYCWGGDGSLSCISPKTFKSVMDRKVSIYDESEQVDKRYTRTKNWLKKTIDKCVVGPISHLLVKKGKVKQIILPYMP